MSQNKVPIKAYSKKELAAMYGISANTLCAWLKKIPVPFFWDIIRTRRVLTPKEVHIVFDHLDPPEAVND